MPLHLQDDLRGNAVNPLQFKKLLLVKADELKESSTSRNAITVERNAELIEESGAFGICQECEEPIGEPRLRIACQERVENFRTEEAAEPAIAAVA
jgi:hypothetical protein